MTDQQKQRLVAVTGQNEIPFISEGVESTTAGYIVGEDGLSRIAAALEAADAASAGLTEVQSQLEAANTARQTAEDNLAAAQQETATANARIEELQARVTELENESGITQTTKGKDNKGGKTKVAAHEDPTVSFNAMADRLMGVPATKDEE